MIFVLKTRDMPWQRPLEVAAETIGRIEVRPYRWRYDGSKVFRHHLWVVHRDGTETCLLERDATEEQSNHLRHEVRRLLGVSEANRSR